MTHYDYQQNFVTGDRLRELTDFCRVQDYKLYPIRGRELKRAPKVEFYTPCEDGTPPLYRWGQERKAYSWGAAMPDVLLRLRAEITEHFDEEPNHCIIIHYPNGADCHAPPHSDKQEGVEGKGAKDIAADTSIYDISIGAARTFQLRSKSSGHLEFDEPLEHGSLLLLTALGNAAYEHSVPLEPDVYESRWSVIFRTIKSSARMVMLRSSAARKACDTRKRNANKDRTVDVKAADVAEVPPVPTIDQSKLQMAKQLVSACGGFAQAISVIDELRSLQVHRT